MSYSLRSAFLSIQVCRAQHREATINLFRGLLCIRTDMKRSAEQFPRLFVEEMADVLRPGNVKGMAENDIYA